MVVSQQEVINKIQNIIDPTIGKTLGELDHIKNIIIKENDIELDIIFNSFSSLKNEIEENIKSELMDRGFNNIEINFEIQITKQIPKSDFGPPGMKALDPIPQIKNVIAVASNKGGVGKSTVAANLTCALQHLGAKVALLDLDLYGPNIPTMFGVSTQRAKYEANEIQSDNPEEKDGMIGLIEQFGIKMMSVGFILPQDDTAVVLRAPLANQLIMEFLNEVAWPEADYLVVDLPPGTGDIQLTLAQQLPNTSIVFVTTPQQVALADVYKGIKMFTDKEINIPVLGIIENMSYFVGDDGKKYEIFGQGGGERVAEDFNIDNFGKIPLVQKIREQGDAGKPIVLDDVNNPVSKTFLSVAEKISSSLARLNYELNQNRQNVVFEELDLM